MTPNKRFYLIIAGNIAFLAFVSFTMFPLYNLRGVLVKAGIFDWAQILLAVEWVAIVLLIILDARILPHVMNAMEK